MILKVLYQCFCFHLNCVGFDLLCNACDSMENSALCLLCFHSLPFSNHSVDTHSIFNSCVGVYVSTYSHLPIDCGDYKLMILSTCMLWIWPFVSRSLSFSIYIHIYVLTQYYLSHRYETAEKMSEMQTLAKMTMTMAMTLTLMVVTQCIVIFVIFVFAFLEIGNVDYHWYVCVSY